MDTDDLNKVLSRIKRIQERLSNKGGTGTAWSTRLGDGETHKYVINGIKGFESIEDDIESLFVWVWSLKDYIKAYSVRKGKSHKWIEEIVNVDPHLSVCADIANRAKHSQLSRSRSGKNPKLGNLKYSIPQEAVESLILKAFEVVIKVTNPNSVSFEMPILDSRNRVLGDAFNFLDYGIKRWEEIIDEMDKAI